MMKLSQSLTTVTPFSKILALILFILFPVIGFVMGVKYQAVVNYSPQNNIIHQQILIPLQKVDNITNWETYVDDEYKFSFQYPKDLVAEKTKTTIHLLKDNEIYAQITFPELYIGAPNEYVDFVTYASHFAKAMCSASGVGSNIYCDKVAEAKGVKNAYRVEIVEMRLHEITETNDHKLVKERDRSIYAINTSQQIKDNKLILMIPDDKFQNNNQLEIFSQILSTFKFTDNNLINGFKYYQNKQLGFSLQIPSAWNIDEKVNTSPFFTDSSGRVTLSINAISNFSQKPNDFLTGELMGSNDEGYVPALVNPQSITIGGETAYLSNNPAVNYENARTIHQETGYLFSFDVGYKNPALFTQILSTFKFTDNSFPLNTQTTGEAKLLLLPEVSKQQFNENTSRQEVIAEQNIHLKNFKYLGDGKWNAENEYCDKNSDKYWLQRACAIGCYDFSRSEAVVCQNQNMGTLVILTNAGKTIQLFCPGQEGSFDISNNKCMVQITN